MYLLKVRLRRDAFICEPARLAASAVSAAACIAERLYGLRGELHAWIEFHNSLLITPLEAYEARVRVEGGRCKVLGAKLVEERVASRDKYLDSIIIVVLRHDDSIYELWLNYGDRLAWKLGDMVINASHSEDAHTPPSLVAEVVKHAAHELITSSPMLVMEVASHRDVAIHRLNLGVSGYWSSIRMLARHAWVTIREDFSEEAVSLYRRIAAIRTDIVSYRLLSRLLLDERLSAELRRRLLRRGVRLSMHSGELEAVSKTSLDPLYRLFTDLLYPAIADALAEGARSSADLVRKAYRRVEEQLLA